MSRDCCAAWPSSAAVAAVAAAGTRQGDAHLLRRFSCLCLTHRPGGMCRPCPDGAPRLPACPVVSKTHGDTL
eukprot:5329895-Prymnesium_polylepis.1